MGSPFPLYSGTILADLHDLGGSAVIALSVRKVARHPIPAVPRNFSSWGGNLLSPRLLHALYLCYNTCASSYCVMRGSDDVAMGVYVSGVILSS